MAIPIVAGVVGVSSIIKSGEAQRRATHIADRVQKYQGYADDQLRDIIKTYGGEMGEAAQQVLSSRGSSAQSTAPAATITERLSSSGGQSTLLIVGGIVLLIVILRGK